MFANLSWTYITVYFRSEITSQICWGKKSEDVCFISTSDIEPWDLGQWCLVLYLKTRANEALTRASISITCKISSRCHLRTTIISKNSQAAPGAPIIRGAVKRYRIKLCVGRMHTIGALVLEDQARNLFWTHCSVFYQIVNHCSTVFCTNNTNDISKW